MRLLDAACLAITGIQEAEANLWRSEEFVDMGRSYRYPTNCAFNMFQYQP
jgi:hypothetical protein